MVPLNGIGPGAWGSPRDRLEKRARMEQRRRERQGRQRERLNEMDAIDSGALVRRADRRDHR